MNKSILSLSAALLGLALLSGCGQSVSDKIISEALEQAQEQAERDAEQAEVEAVEEAAEEAKGPVGGTELSKEELLALFPKTLMDLPMQNDKVNYTKMGDLRQGFASYKQDKSTIVLTIRDTYGSDNHLPTTVEYEYENEIGTMTNRSLSLGRGRVGTVMINNDEKNPSGSLSLNVGGRFGITVNAVSIKVTEEDMIDLVKEVDLDQLQSLAK